MLGDKIRSLLMLKRIKQKDIAEELNRSKQSINNTLNKNTLRVSMLVGICELCNCRLSIIDNDTGHELYTIDKNDF